MSILFGFIDHENNMDALVSTIGIETVYNMIAASAKHHTEELNQIYSTMIGQGTEVQLRVKIANDPDLQPISDVTQPFPMHVTGEYTQGFPLDKAGIGWGTDRKSRHTMNINEAQALTLSTLKADARWIRRRVLASLFTESTYTFADELLGDVSVRPLANGDTVTYLKTTGAISTADHYLAQANAIGNAGDNPFPTIYSTLQAYPTNRGKDVIVYVADGLIASVEALTDYVEISDTALILASSTTSINTGAIPNTGPGEEIIGRVGKCWIARWSQIPATYMLAVIVNPDIPLVRQRNDTVPALQGFFPEANPGDGNLLQLNMIRYAGFGVYNRTGALCYRVGNAAWADPTDAAAPLIA